MSKILVLREKYGERHLGPFETNAEREMIAKRVVQDRINDGFWYTDGEDVTASIAITNNRAWQFLQFRNKAEYEQVDEVILD